ncbi:MAG: hypothetical protein M0Z30_03890 [Actinomycetota bacterium]|nr:hypothetical protein [Actinomycetota bacterium]
MRYTGVSCQLEATDWEEAIEIYHRNGWTDGLPIIPPTPARVAEFVAAAGGRPSDPIGHYALRDRPVTLEKLAINSVMAGCLPEYLPVVAAIVGCMLEPGFDVHTANSSTGSLALGFVVNGPIRHLLGMNTQGDVLGPGNRANASIARALRLIQINVMGSVSGAGAPHSHDRPVLDRSTMGHPAKYVAYHVAEFEEAYRELTPLHVMLGFDPADSVVSAFAVGNHIMLSNHAETGPEEWIASVAHYLVGAGRLDRAGFGVLLVPPEPAGMFVDAGWSKLDISRALYESTRRSAAWVKQHGWKVGGRFERGAPVEWGDAEQMLAAAGRPEDLHVVVCGGPAGNFLVYMQTYASSLELISRRIGRPGRTA